MIEELAAFTQGGPPDVDRMMAVFAAHGVEVGPPPD
jgi:hypothetical protein